MASATIDRRRCAVHLRVFTPPMISDRSRIDRPRDRAAPV